MIWSVSLWRYSGRELSRGSKICRKHSGSSTPPLTIKFVLQNLKRLATLLACVFQPQNKSWSSTSLIQTTKANFPMPNLWNLTVISGLPISTITSPASACLRWKTATVLPQSSTLRWVLPSTRLGSRSLRPLSGAADSSTSTGKPNNRLIQLRTSKAPLAFHCSNSKSGNICACLTLSPLTVISGQQGLSISTA